MADYDAIVIGAGHNGLAAAAELAKEGMKVVVLEKTNFPGGMAATKEIFKGYKHSVGAWALLVFRQKMMDNFELEKYGLEFIRPPTSYCVFGAPEDPPFIAYRDPTEMAEHLMKDHGIDAVTGLANMAAYIEPFKLMMDAESFKEPTPIHELIANAPDAHTREVLLRLNTDSAMGVLRQFFPDPGKHNTILGSLCASAIDGTHMGPFTPGSALSLAYHYCAGDAYDFKIPRGGIGALSYALESCAQDRGAEIRYKAQVSRFIIDGGRITGVELRNGETLTANVILSSLDARTTFSRLTGEEHLPEQFNHAVREIQYTNGYMQLHMTLDELPEFEGPLAFTNKNNVRWLMAYIPSAEHLSRCWDEYRRNEVPEHPVAYCYFPSLTDPTLAPEGKHTCTIFSHYFPAEIPKGKHNEYKDLMAERAIDQIQKVAGNFRESITGKIVFTHEYFEKTFGITAGDFCHGLMHPGQMFENRPVPGHADYRTPIEGLYMCGASCHPGPGITCIPGYNGARAVLADSKG